MLLHQPKAVLQRGGRPLHFHEAIAVRVGILCMHASHDACDGCFLCLNRYLCL